MLKFRFSIFSRGTLLPAFALALSLSTSTAHAYEMSLTSSGVSLALMAICNFRAPEYRHGCIAQLREIGSDPTVAQAAQFLASGETALGEHSSPLLRSAIATQRKKMLSSGTAEANDRAVLEQYLLDLVDHAQAGSAD